MTAVTGVDFVSVPTLDLSEADAFYGETVGLRAHPDRTATTRRCRWKEAAAARAQLEER